MDACRRKFQLWKRHLSLLLWSDKDAFVYYPRYYSCLRTYTNGLYSGRLRFFVKDQWQQLHFHTMTGLYQITFFLGKKAIYCIICNLFWRSKCVMESVAHSKDFYPVSCQTPEMRHHHPMNLSNLKIQTHACLWKLCWKMCSSYKMYLHKLYECGPDSFRNVNCASKLVLIIASLLCAKDKKEQCRGPQGL